MDRREASGPDVDVVLRYEIFNGQTCGLAGHMEREPSVRGSNDPEGSQISHDEGIVSCNVAIPAHEREDLWTQGCDPSKIADQYRVCFEIQFCLQRRLDPHDA